MKKKLAVILGTLLLCIPLLTGCGSQPSYVPPHAREWGYFYYPGTDWGMTFDELCSALERAPSDFTSRKEEYGPLKSLTHYQTSSGFMGQNCDTDFIFVSIPASSRLALQKVQFDYLIGEQDFTEFCKNLDLLVEEQGAKTTGKVGDPGTLLKTKTIKDADGSVTEITPTDPNYDGAEAVKETQKYTITCDKNMPALPQELRDGYNSWLHSVIGTQAWPDEPLGYQPDTDFAQSSGGIPFSQLTIRYTNDFEKQSISCQIIFDGRGVAEPVGYTAAAKSK